MSDTRPRLTLEQDGAFTRVNMEYTADTLDAMARRAVERIEDELVQQILARLGYVQVVRCGECKYDTLDHTDHNYRETLYCGFHRMDVSPDHYCAWGKRKEEHE